MATGQAFCIFIDTHCERTEPSVWDEEGKPCVFATRVDAEREIADNMITRLQEFIDGERDYDDAMTVEEYVMEVAVLTDGSVVDSNGTRYCASTQISTN